MQEKGGAPVSFFVVYSLSANDSLASGCMLQTAFVHVSVIIGMGERGNDGGREILS
jgi:hypothetical protein